MYISAGPTALLDGGNLTTVATCIAEHARPSATVVWESVLYGTSEAHVQDDGNGTTTTQVHYTWEPTRHAQGDNLTCVVRHPALPSEFRMPYVINVQCECPLHGVCVCEPFKQQLWRSIAGCTHANILLFL